MNVKLTNGDCLAVMAKIPDNSIDLIVTDPPYRITSRGNCGTMSGYMANELSLKGRIFLNNDIDIEEYLPEFYRTLKDGTHCYIMTNQSNLPHFIDVINQSPFKFIKCLIWDKCNKICGRYYMNCFEYIIMLRKGRERTINDCGQGDLIRVPNSKHKKSDGTNIHDSEKPVRLMQILVANSSNEGDVILDPFMGSGSTGVACVNTDRDFIGIELNEEYFKIAERRINDAISEKESRLF